MVSRVRRLEGLTPSPEWMTWSNCRDTDPDLFFPDKGGSTAEAKRICSRCPVEFECLEWALDNGELFGVWGGTSERTRVKLRRMRVKY